MDYKLEDAMKNHPGFMPFTHCNVKTNIEETKKEQKTEQEKDKK